MTSLLSSLKKTPIGKAINKHRAFKSAAKLFYKITMFSFTRKGIDVNIGGAGSYKLDYNFALRDYESFGDKHNAGFAGWIAYCKNKHTVFDIGAHIGLYAIPASKVISSDGRIYAFEPGAANRKYLMRHLGYNGINNVIIVPYLAGEKSKKEQVFYENRNTDPMNSLYPKKNINLYENVLREQVSLDDFVRRSRNEIAPEVIKIDVEGAEYNVLKGSGEIMAKYSPVIFLSVHPKQLTMFKSSAIEVLRLINSFQYIAYDCAGKEVSELGAGEFILHKKGENLKNGQRDLA